jgi:hypothetical protein
MTRSLSSIFNTNDIQNINGYSYNSFDNSYIYYDLIVTLINGVKYALKLYRNTRQQNQPYLILSIVLSDNSLNEKFTFSQDLQESS